MDGAAADQHRGETPGRPATFLSIRDVQERWSCGKSFVYTAIAEMETQGYLKRFWLGKHQRIALDSLERYEAAHAAPEKDIVRSTVVQLRAASATPPPATASRQLTREQRLAEYRKAL